MADFLNMGDYGFYVWSAYGVTAVVLIVNAVLPVLRERQLRRELARRAKRDTNRC